MENTKYLHERGCLSLRCFYFTGHRVAGIKRWELGVRGDVPHGLENPRDAVGEGTASDHRRALGAVRLDMACRKALRHAPRRVTDEVTGSSVCTRGGWLQCS